MSKLSRIPFLYPSWSQYLIKQSKQKCTIFLMDTVAIARSTLLQRIEKRQPSYPNGEHSCNAVWFHVMLLQKTFQRAMMAIFKKYLQKLWPCLQTTSQSTPVKRSTCIVYDWSSLGAKKKRCALILLSVGLARLFGRDRGKLLGHVVSSKGIEVTTTKIKAILEARPLRNANEVASFLRFINFYKRFIDRLVE